MASKYQIGQKVVVRPVGEPGVSLRDSGLEAYAGEIGEVTDFYRISPDPGQTFYVYTVRIGTSKKTVILHEDELEAR